MTPERLAEIEAIVNDETPATRGLLAIVARELLGEVKRLRAEPIGYAALPIVPPDAPPGLQAPRGVRTTATEAIADARHLNDPALSADIPGFTPPDWRVYALVPVPTTEGDPS